MSDMVCSEVDGPCILVPISQIEGMSDTEMATAIRGLVDEAKMTGLLEWLDKWPFRYEWPMRLENNPQKRFVNCCMFLGGQDEYTQSRVEDLDEKLRMMEKFRHQDDGIQEGFSEICELLDGAYNFLLNKRKLTPGQQRARAVILKLRNGCALCGRLNGQHTEQCLTLRKSSAVS